MARSRPLLCFIFLCIHSTYSSLRQTGLDILGNISYRMDLLELGGSIMECTYKTLQQCVLSANKFDQIRGFEILGNLCRCSSNKDCLILTISDEIYSHALHLVTLGDIELLIAALDALYGMSKLGEESCTRIMLIPGSIDILICLITINIRTFDPSQLSKIRVARHVLPTNAPPNAPVKPAPSSMAHATSHQNHHSGVSSSIHPSTQLASINQPHPLTSPQFPSQPTAQPQFHQQQYPIHRVRPPMNPQVPPMNQHHPPVHQPPNPPSFSHQPPPKPYIPAEKPHPRQQSPLPNKQQPVKVPAPAQGHSKTVEPQNSAPQKPLQPHPSTPQTSSSKNPSPQVSVHPAGVVPVYTHTEHQFVPPVYHYIPAPPSDIVLDKSPQSFAQLWVWATYESCENDEGSTPRVEVFAQYAAAASRYGMCGAKQVLPASEFGRCLQRVFPHTASRLFKDKKGQPLYHITGLRKRPTPFPVPGHHPQASTPHGGSKTNQSTSLNHSRPSKTMSDGPAHSSSAAKSSLPAEQSTAPAHSVDTSTVTAPPSGLRNNDEANTRGSAVAEVENIISSTLATKPEIPSNANAEIDQAKPSSIPQPQNKKTINGRESKTPLNVAIDNSHEPKNHINNSNHTPDAESKCVEDESASQSNFNCSKDKAESAVEDSAAGNHCDAHGTIQLKNGRTNCDVSEKEINATSGEENPSSVPQRFPSKALEPAEAALCNGELPPSGKDVNKKVPGRDQISKPVDSSKTVQINGVLEGSKETALNDYPDMGSSQEICIVNGQLNETKLPPPKAMHETNLSERHNSPQVVISPQTNPIEPDQLQKHYKTQSQKPIAAISEPKFESNLNNAPAEATPTSTIKTEPKTTTEATAASSNQSVNLKRRHTSFVHSSDTPPPAKMQKTVERSPPPPLIKQPLIPPPTTTNIAKVVHPPMSQVHSPAAKPSSTSVFRHPIPSSSHSSVPHHPPAEDHNSPASQTHAHRKAPVVDLMAPNASLLVLYRNSGKCSFEDATDEKEDPISKSVRLTAVLILINISNYSDEGRSKLQRHEPLLAYLSMSGMDCSPMLAKLLSQLDR